MSQVNVYASIAKRTFESALVHLLETEYGLLGGRRILVKAAAAQGGLLTIAELSVLLNKSYEVIRGALHDWETETGDLLPLKGARLDQGSRPTHKKEIARLYEQGLEPPDIARETSHSLKSVERYLKDYERVKLLLKRGLGVAEISAAIGRGQSVVLEYLDIARQHHPDLFVDRD